MLADALDDMRGQLVDDLERLIAGTARPRLMNGARRARLDLLVGQVIAALRQSAYSELAAAPCPVADPELELDEHELVERYLLEKIEQKGLETSPSEAARVQLWRYDADRQCLREQNRRLAALLDGVYESAALLAPDGRLLYCNRQAAQVLHEAAGIPRDELVGKTPDELGVPLEAIVGRPIGELVAMARAHDSYEVNVWGRSKETQFDAVYGRDGEVAAVALLVRDVHGRKQAQTRLGLLSKLSGLTGILDYDDVARRLARVPIPELADWCAVNVVEDRRVRRTFVATRDPSQAQLRNAIVRAGPAWERHPLWQELLSGGFQLLTEVSDDLLRRLSATEEQYRLLSRLGICSLMVVPLISRARTTGIVTLAYTGQSGRRYGRDDPALAEEFALHAAHALQNARLMKELRSSEERFRVALAGARTVVFEQDAALRYTWYYSPPARGGLPDRTPEEWLPPREAASLTDTKRRVLATGESVFDEVDWTLARDERRHYQQAIEPIRDRTGKVVGIIGTATDITEQDQMKRQLTEELRFREKMMGILGHDLRNPLNAITMAGELLLRRPELPAGGRDQVLRIRRASERMKEMIDTLLDFTRARFLGHIPLSPVTADLGDIARSVIDEIRAMRPDHRIDLQVRGESGGVWDPARVAQVISNLVGNAISYGDEGSPVRVAVDGDDREVFLSVMNEGAPISAELLPVIFEPFRRGLPEDRSPGGLGLGLFVARQIAVAHAGEIGVQSTAQHGTTFTLRLPRARASDAAPRAG